MTDFYFNISFFSKKEEIANLPVCRESSIHRRANSEAFAKYLYEEKVVLSYKHAHIIIDFFKTSLIYSIVAPAVLFFHDYTKTK